MFSASSVFNIINSQSCLKTWNMQHLVNLSYVSQLCKWNRKKTKFGARQILKIRPNLFCKFNIRKRLYFSGKQGNDFNFDCRAFQTGEGGSTEISPRTGHLLGQVDLNRLKWEQPSTRNIKLTERKNSENSCNCQMQLSAKQIQRKPIPSETINQANLCTACNQKPFAGQNFCVEKTDQSNSKCLFRNQNRSR